MVDDRRRLSPRIALDGLCGLVTDRAIRHVALVDVSASGLRIEHPFDRAFARRSLQFEIELPGVDDILWACGRLTFAQYRPMDGCDDRGQPRFWCRAGIRIDRACDRDLRVIRDYVHSFMPRFDAAA